MVTALKNAAMRARKSVPLVEKQGSHLSVLILANIVATLAAADTYANDGFAQIGVGGVVLSKTDDIAIKRETLTISCDRINVDYEFVNDSDSDVSTPILFPLPPYHAFLGVYNYLVAKPQDFTVRFDDLQLPSTIKVRAQQGGQDVTADLTALGLSPTEIAYFPVTSFSDREGLIISPELEDGLRTHHLWSDNRPDWDIAVNYQWLATFPKHKTVHVHHGYSPLIALGTASAFDFDPSSRRSSIGGVDPSAFCMTPEQENLLIRESKGEHRGPYGVNGTVIDYILTTANTWKDGIQEFELKVALDSPTEILASCFKPSLTPTGPTTYTARVDHFRPDADLRLYIGNLRSKDCQGDAIFKPAVIPNVAH